MAGHAKAIPRDRVILTWAHAESLSGERARERRTSNSEGKEERKRAGKGSVRAEDSSEEAKGT
jgi:hypothetical protein